MEIKFCHLVKRNKKLFETEEEANGFIEESNISYYCVACKGWHITSKNTIIYGFIKKKKIARVDSKISNEAQLFKKEVTELNKEISEIEMKLGKRRYKTYPKEVLIEYLERISRIENRIIELISSKKRKKILNNKLGLLKERIFKRLTLDIYRKIISRIDEVGRLREYGAILESIELLNEVTIEVMDLETKIGYSGLTLDLRKRLEELRKGN